MRVRVAGQAGQAGQKTRATGSFRVSVHAYNQGEDFKSSAEDTSTRDSEDSNDDDDDDDYIVYDPSGTAFDSATQDSNTTSDNSSPSTHMPSPFDHDAADYISTHSDTDSIDNASSFDIGDRNFVHGPGGEDSANIKDDSRPNNDNNTSSTNSLLSSCAPQVLASTVHLTSSDDPNGGNDSDNIGDDTSNLTSSDDPNCGNDSNNIGDDTSSLSGSIRTYDPGGDSFSNGTTGKIDPARDDNNSTGNSCNSCNNSLLSYSSGQLLDSVDSRNDNLSISNSNSADVHRHELAQVVRLVFNAAPLPSAVGHPFLPFVHSQLADATPHIAQA